MTIKVSKPAKGLREAIAEVIGRGASVINGMTKGDAQDELEVSRKNWIINGDMQVDQRNSTKTSATNGTYYLDRWRLWSSGAGLVADISIETTNQPPNAPDGSKSQKVIASTGTSLGDMRLNQPIEDHDSLSGQIVTISSWVKTNSSNCRLYFYTNPPGDYSEPGFSQPVNSDGEWNKVEFTVKLPNNLTYLVLVVGIDGDESAQVNITTGEYFEFTNVKLEIGDTATPFESRSYGEELRDCQRYYETNDVEEIWMGDITSGSNYYYTVPYKVEKRVTPTETVTHVGDAGFTGSPTVNSTYSDKNKMVVQEAANTTQAAGNYRFDWTADAELP